MKKKDNKTTNEASNEIIGIKLCHDCDAKPGELHNDDCDVERCPACGGQLLSCECSDDEINKYSRLPWTGECPGKSECREFGWYAKFVEGQGWVSCDKNDEGATEDLNRLYSDAAWNVKLGKFVIGKNVKKKKTALYYRASTKGQNALAKQKKNLMDYVHEKKITNFTLYFDVGSFGTSIERPALQHLIADIKEGKIGALVVTNHNRLLRAYPDQNEETRKHMTELADLFLENGVKYISLEDLE